MCGPGSSVGIATGYGLDCPGIESPVSLPLAVVVSGCLTLLLRRSQRLRNRAEWYGVEVILLLCMVSVF
jgi:hypothetical protein